MQSEIYDKLTAIFRDVFDDERIVLSPGLSAKDLDVWDSLNHVRLMLAVAKSFKTKFTAAEISRLQNVGDLAKLIEAKSPQVALTS